MAKKPETREVYRIHGETSKEEFGEYLAVLTKMGMQNIGYELVTEVARFKQRRQSGDGETAGMKNEDIVRAYAAKNPSFSAKDMVAHFEALGRHPASAYQAMRNLLEARFLSRSAPGKYHLSSMKALPPPASVPTVRKAKAAKPAKKAKVAKKANAGEPPKLGRGHAPRLAIGNYSFMWSLLKNRKTVDVRLLNERFIADGRNMKSVSPVLTKMAHQGVVAGRGEGVWEVIGKPPQGQKLVGIGKKSNSGAEPEPAAEEGVANGGE